MHEPNPSTHRWLRFSLAAMTWLVTMIAVGLSITVSHEATLVERAFMLLFLVMGAVAVQMAIRPPHT